MHACKECGGGRMEPDGTVSAPEELERTLASPSVVPAFGISGKDGSWLFRAHSDTRRTWVRVRVGARDVGLVRLTRLLRLRLKLRLL